MLSKFIFSFLNFIGESCYRYFISYIVLFFKYGRLNVYETKLMFIFFA